MKRIFKTAVTLMCFATISACSDHKKPSIQMVYTSSNSASDNHVVALTLKSNGQLEQTAEYSTGGQGTGAGFPNQGSIRVIDDHLLVVNAGGDTNGSISVFDINPSNGALTRVDQDLSTDGIQNMDSQGYRPSSIDIVQHNSTQYAVVTNQYQTPECEKVADNRNFFDCLDADGNSMSDLRDNDFPGRRNIAIFRFENGRLFPLATPHTFTVGVGGPVQASFSPDGTKLALTTFGIPNAANPADPTQQQPSRVFLFNTQFSQDTLSLEEVGSFANRGISASVGFSWSSDSRYLYVTNAILSATQQASNVITLDTTDVGNQFNTLDDQIPAGTGEVMADGRPAACWTWLSANNRNLYVVSSEPNRISYFHVDGSQLSLIDQVDRKSAPAGDAKDIIFNRDNELALVLGGESHTVSIFQVANDGKLTELDNSPLQLTLPNDDSRRYIGLAIYPAQYMGF
ncbi:beta-propeller fold lactonase family protein [Parashewanella tropica]|uniref:beta-propeller fold lactonase family protein n=1 Tax=Parashewanella tropica TaxID=2547970 RepID=UPI00105938C8|nr:beta-propeller fold lactonase family protein [Parashewanella tropica]